MIETIEDQPMFEAAGWKVYFDHLHDERNFLIPPHFVGVPGKPHLRKQVLPAAKGTTTCHVMNENVAFTEVSRCSMHDNFNRYEGRKQALRKVMIANFTRPQRALFWYEYFKAMGMISRAFQINQKWHCKPVQFNLVP